MKLTAKESGANDIFTISRKN